MVGAKDRETNRVAAKAVAATDKETLQAFAKDWAAPQATVYTDDASAYETPPFEHETVKHSVRDMCAARRTPMESSRSGRC